MEKQTMEQLEERMDKVIEQLAAMPVTDRNFEGLLEELRQLEAKVAAITARKSTFSGMNEVATINLGK